MKNHFIFICIMLLHCTNVFSQTPQAFKYQAVARNISGEILENQPIAVKISILAGGASGSVSYSEKHEVVTNPFGLFDLEIGNGTDFIFGSFEAIDWGADQYYLKIEIDPNGGDDFELMGISQFLSVPYALYAEKSKYTDQGIPAMTEEERDALVDPEVGMQIYNITSNCLNYFNGTSWFETCGDCTPQPTVPDAGADQPGVGGNNTILAGNTPMEGSGLWQVVAGSGGTLDNPTSPNSTFYGTTGINYLLTWTISNACASLSDTVAILFWDCDDLLIDTRDGKNYSTVQVGTQCWMAQNLNTGTRIAANTNSSNNGAIEKYCYNDTESNCDVYGGLYQWNEMMSYTTTEGVQGICMAGWRLPTDAEFTEMETYVNSQPAYKCNSTNNYIAKSLAAKTNWSASTNICAVGNNPSANNATGFGALPGSYRTTNGTFILQPGYYGHFWSSTALYETYAYNRTLWNANASMLRDIQERPQGFSVRCVKDNSTAQLSVTPSTQGVSVYAGWTSFNITANTTWTVTESVAWLTVTPMSGSNNGEIGVSYDENTSYESRNGQITITAGGGTSVVNVTVNQAGRPFTCGQAYTDARDGKVYSTVQIGAQCWMAQNLNVGTMINGAANSSNNGTIEKYCYNNNETNCNTYGGLYQWDEMMNYTTNAGLQGICMTGWHVPTDAEITGMENYVNSQAAYKCNSTNDYIAKSLAAKTNWATVTVTCAIGNNLSANNATGFTALPGGTRNLDGSFDNMGTGGHLWSSTQSDTSNAWGRLLAFFSRDVARNSPNKPYGSSIRCLKDN